MVESSDLQAAVQRTQALERLQQLQNQQEELNRKRFELELARERAEKRRKVADAEQTDPKQVVRDHYDGSRDRQAPDRQGSDEQEGKDGGDEGPPPEAGPERGGNVDVVV